MFDVSYGVQVQPPAILLSPDKGSSEQVKEWQSYLIKKGYNIGSYCVDGDFGPATQRATRELAQDLVNEGNRDAIQSVASGHVTLALWNSVSDDEAIFMREVTSADKDRGCPGWRGGVSSSSAPVASTGGPAQPGPLGKVAKAAMSPRGLIIGASVLAIGAGLFGAFGRRNYHYGDWA